MTKVHFHSYIHKKMILFPQRIDKDIAEDDPVRLLDALVDNLMLDNVYKLYKASGRKPYHPQMMLKVILYAYMNNIYSCRRIESLLKRDIRPSARFRLPAGRCAIHAWRGWQMRMLPAVCRQGV